MKSSTDIKRKTLEKSRVSSMEHMGFEPTASTMRMCFYIFVTFSPSENVRFCWVSDGVCLYCCLFFFFIGAYSSQKVPTYRKSYTPADLAMVSSAAAASLSASAIAWV